MTSDLPYVGFDLYRVAAIKQEADATRARKPGRPRRYPKGAREWVRVQLPLDLIEQMDAANPNRTAFIEAAVRAALELAQE